MHQRGKKRVFVEISTEQLVCQFRYISQRRKHFFYFEYLHGFEKRKKNFLRYYSVTLKEQFITNNRKVLNFVTLLLYKIYSLTMKEKTGSVQRGS